jgi:demethylspheroidene O-methyltransferase
VALPSYWKRLRRRLLSDPKFIAFAQKFPLTRPVARRKSLELFDLLAGFSYSQVLFACVELKLFDHAGSTIPELASKIGLTENKAGTLVRAATAIGLLDLDGEAIILGPHGAALVAQPWIMRFVEHHKHFYRDLEDPVGLLKGNFAPGGLREYWDYDDPEKDRSAYSALMAASQQSVAAQILDAYDMSKHQTVLDVGGGTGAFLKAARARHPHLSLNVFDLPDVTCDDPNITRFQGDFLQNLIPQNNDLLPLKSHLFPPNMDLITVVRVIHDHDDDSVLHLLHNIRKACQKDTVLLIAEPFAGNKATAAVTDAYFNMYFAAMGQGRTRTPQEIAALAAQAGFDSLKVWPTNMPLITGVLTLLPKN